MDRMARRLTQLYAGLALYGLGIALQVASGLGNDPWDVFHQGLSRRFGLSIGVWIIIVGAVVMLLWIPLRQRPGIGTVSNVVFVGLFADFFLWALPDPSGVWRAVYLVLAVLMGGVATGCYIGAGLGPGPRDGLMTGYTRRSGRSIRIVRTGIEITVLAIGWLLGGTVGVGTILYAVAIGPLTQVFLPLFSVKDAASVPEPIREPAAT